MDEHPITSTPDLTRLRKSIGGKENKTLRRSLIPQLRRLQGDEKNNDDDAERLLLVATETAVSTPRPSTPRSNSSRDTVFSSPQKEHFQGCLKLYTENKINKDNAWSLHLIDFMASMLRRHDKCIENLQTASTLVDASAKIYSIRVDAVHYDVLKMAGGLSKATLTKRGKKDDDNDVQDEGALDGTITAEVKKKKKKTRTSIASNIEMFNGDFDTKQDIDPLFERLAATAGDITASNRALNATLSIQHETLALIVNIDLPFLQSVKGRIGDLVHNERTLLSEHQVEPYTKDHCCCKPFSQFSISNWDPETEDVENKINDWAGENPLNLSQQAVAFDINAEVEPIPLDEQYNDLLEDEPLAGIESEEEADVAVAACVARAGAAGPGGLVRLTDMRPLSTSDARLEYSYCGAIVSAWAGPSHWRLKNNKAAERTQSTAAGRLPLEVKKQPRTKRQLDFMGAGLAFDFEATPSGDYERAPPAKIMISRKTLATGHTWNEANFKTPVDRGLDESHFRKLFLRRNVLLKRIRELEHSKHQPEPATEPLTLDENPDYNYENDNDASYCSNNIGADAEWGNEDGITAGKIHCQQKAAESGEIGEMLEQPAKIPKIFIPYAMRAKKVDMKQLKHATWNLLTNQTTEGGVQQVSKTTFFSIYSRLPSKLSPGMKESLSVPLALLSVLHLANEKGLILEKRDDLKDIGIVGLIGSNVNK